MCAKRHVGRPIVARTEPRTLAQRKRPHWQREALLAAVTAVRPEAQQGAQFIEKTIPPGPMNICAAATGTVHNLFVSSARSNER
jgi:hypothetical protein